MKIAIFADIHSNYLVFKKAYEDAINKNVDMFLFLGDYITDGFDGDKILDIIRKSKGYAINGNREVSIVNYDKTKDERWDKYIQRHNMKYGYDHLSKENLEYLKTLPIYRILTINNKKICISHSSPYNVKGDVYFDSYEIFDKLINDYDCDIYLFGHEHKTYLTEYKGKLFINVGSIGLPTDGLPYKYGMLVLNEKIEYESVGINYDFKVIEEYYKNSDYYKKNEIWCSLLLMLIKTGENHTQNFMDYIYKKAKEKNIDISYAIPNELFIESYYEYINTLD